ncbi:Winged helix-like DNA-binding domain superfamily [Sesbania bispinosa]|nr:Winged helix-like DNA-binding domain superfamily [Sesbania bispinosa]
MAKTGQMIHVAHVDSTENQHNHNQQEILEEKSFTYAMHLVNSSVLSMAMHSAIELGIFDIIDKAGVNTKLSAKDIAAHLPCKNPDATTMLDRILRLLASHSVIDCTIVGDEQGPPPYLQRLYSIAPVGKYFACNGGGGSLGPLMVLTQDKAILQSWYQLKDAILEGGIPFNRVHEKHVFEYSDLNPSFNKLFMAAMTNRATLIMKKILEYYKGFEHINRLVDVGGGLGVTINIITSKYPHIQGINFDLPHVVEHASPYPGVEHVGGDMFENVPEGDAILMMCVLHDWSDEFCLKVLKNCYGAIPNDGKVIVVEGVLPFEPETRAAVKSISQFDVLMMTTNPGGKERSEEEFMALAKGAGFNGVRYACFVCDVWVMEFFK